MKKLALIILLLALPAFVNAAVFTNATCTAQVTWTAPPDLSIVGYTVLLGTNSFWPSGKQATNPVVVQMIDAGTNTTITVSNLAHGMTFYCVVASRNAIPVWSDYSAEGTATTPGTKPMTPTLSTFVLLSGGPTPAGPWEPIDLLAEYWINPDCDYAFYRAKLEIHR